MKFIQNDMICEFIRKFMVRKRHVLLVRGAETKWWSYSCSTNDTFCLFTVSFSNNFNECVQLHFVVTLNVLTIFFVNVSEFTYFYKMAQVPITDFLKKKKVFVSEKINNHLKKAKEKCNENDTEKTIQSLVAENSMLKQEVNALQKNLKEAKKIIRRIGDESLAKDLKIRELERQLPEPTSKRDVLFEQYSNQFTPQELKEVASIGPGQANDSNFILKILRLLYKGEEAKLENRSMCGKRYRGEKKMEITMEKKELMKNMLGERLEHELSEKTSASEEFTKRNKNLKKLVTNAIYNIVNTDLKKRKKRNEDKSDETPPAPKRKKLTSSK